MEIEVTEAAPEPVADDTVVVAPTVIVPDSTDDDSDLAYKLGEACARIEALEARLAETTQTAEVAEEVADAALTLAVEEAITPDPEPVVVVEEEADEEPIKEPWTHRSFGFGRKD